MTEKINETKKKILTNALQLIKEHGYDNVTLNDICKASSVSKHTFYYYFSSKEDLLIQFFTIPNEISASKLAELLSTEHYFEQYWQLIEPPLDFFLEIGVEISKRIIIANLNRDLGTFHRTQMQNDLLKAEILMIKKAQENKEILNDSDPLALIWTSKSQLFGLLTSWCMTNGCMDLKYDYRTSIELIFNVEPSLRKGDFAVIRENLLHFHTKKGVTES